MKTKRMTMAQALVAFLKNQYVERDNKESPFFAGVWGIFGHGNVAGLGQALHQSPEIPYYLCRNEQAMVHTAAAFAKMKNRLSTFACATSIGPGATNMVTGAAAATINRLPVLLLPGDIFSRRNVAPVLQQLESEISQDISVNDVFKPVSRYWDRINRPDQLPFSLAEAMRILTSPAHTGAVTLALPQDVQSEAWDYPETLFEKRIWHVARPLADRELLRRAIEWMRAARQPLIIAGGGVHYADAWRALAALTEKTGIPICETQAGKGSLPYNHPQQLGAVGVTGSIGANICAREADLIIGVGTRYTDFTTASKTAFQHPDVRFININITEFDAFKHHALPLVSDARVTLEELTQALNGYRVADEYAERISNLQEQWELELSNVLDSSNAAGLTQASVINIVNSMSDPRDVVVCAAGSLPGDLHKLWRTRDCKGYHLEYGYSCMGYEIAGGLGVKMADPSREVYVMVGDGSYQMMSSEIVTSLQEDYKLTIILLDNHGFSSIGGLSKAVGAQGFGTEYRFRTAGSKQLDGGFIPVDFASNAASYGAHVIKACSGGDLESALTDARSAQQTTVIVIDLDKEDRVSGYESWWDVPVAEVSEVDTAVAARKEYDQAIKYERFLF